MLKEPHPASLENTAVQPFKMKITEIPKKNVQTQQYT